MFIQVGLHFFLCRQFLRSLFRSLSLEQLLHAPTNIDVIATKRLANTFAPSHFLAYESLQGIVPLHSRWRPLPGTLEISGKPLLLFWRNDYVFSQSVSIVASDEMVKHQRSYADDRRLYQWFFREVLHK